MREGDPAALAALCAVRGPSVLAYCRQVAGEAAAGAAAADAFARFRVAVVAAGDTASLNPEALLISATRTAAAAHAAVVGQGDCADVPALLAARADKSISVADFERLEAHLEHCWACRAPVARFKSAERAYRDPPEKTVEPALTALIVEALVAAVPPPAPPEPPAVSANGAAPHAGAAPVADPHATQAFAIEQPTEHVAAAGMVDPEPDVGASAAAGRQRRRSAKRAAAAAAPLEPGALRARRERSRSGRRLGVVLPIVVILLAILGALYVSGVFGGDDPASSPTVDVPLAEPAAGEPELVVVPGAKDASAAAIERAKARKRGDSVPAKQDSAKAKRADSSAPAASSPPPPPAASPPPAPAVSANNPVTKPAAPKPSSNAGGEKQIDAGSGATGAEQIPPAADASDVPDLAPPLEPATP